MKICITGAHFTPAQATIEELASDPQNQIIYIGRKYTLEGDKTASVESQVLPALGVKFIPIVTGRLRRYLSVGTIVSLLKIPLGLIQSFYILVRERPDVILSFGGYVGVPVVICGWLLSIPIIVHEQTLVSGLSNSISNFFANKVAVSFDRDYSFKKSKMILTGNPLRAEILNPSSNLSGQVSQIVKSAKDKKLPIILITGGNQGSHSINQAVENCLYDLTKKAYVIHQTGDSKFEDFERLANKQSSLKNPDSYLPLKWIDSSDMGGILKRVDLVVSRAGANTLLELAYFGVPTLCIPIDFASRDEQNQNARFFKKAGLVEILPQSELSSRKLSAKVAEMLKDEDRLRSQSLSAKSLVIPDAAKRLAAETIVLGSR